MTDRNFFDILDGITIQTDSNLEVVYINKKFLNIEKEDWLGKNLQKFPFWKSTQDSPCQTTWSWLSYSITQIPLFKNAQISEILVVIKDEKIQQEMRQESIESAKSELICTLSHEIRNPLQAISYSIENLSSHVCDKQGNEMLDQIKVQLGLISTILGDLCVTTKLVQSKMNLLDSPRNDGSSELGGLKILIAEDNLVIHKSVIKILQNMKIATIMSAYDGIEVLEIVEKNEPFDVILMDIQMPRMDGFETTRCIRNLDEKAKANIPIIFCSGNALEVGMEELCKNWKIDTFLSKPVGKDTLRFALENISNLK